MNGRYDFLILHLLSREEMYGFQVIKVEENGGYYLSGNKLIILDFRTLRSYTRK